MDPSVAIDNGGTTAPSRLSKDFDNEEWRFFEVDFRPDGADQTYTFKFKHQLYIN